MTVSNRYKIVLNATLFNLLFEYSLRGVNSLLNQPLLPFILFLTYFTYFNVVEDLICRYRLKDYHLIVIGFIYGNIASTILPGGVFSQPTYLGINWGNLLFINIIWWGIIQGILTFYIATRITPRDFNDHFLSWRGWLLSIIAIISTLTILRMGIRNTPVVKPVGLITLWILTLISIGILRRLMRHTNEYTPVHKPIKVLDILSILTVTVFTVSSVFLPYNPQWVSIHYVNTLALKFMSFYTMVIAILIIFYRIISHKEIPI